ncbi:OsmC family protein [Cochlodiniinecator piscidefendens]|uniref:OsmC family protein n=1 Tax=Cochlodiniinecator piscidefendens TaxID=2715756 RepID=UPI00140946CD|nr:OsmC family protein [Cochlodiniinecator piscidefendens]
MAIRQKTTVPSRMTARCPSHARTDISIRDLVTIIDEPVERGGSNLGASPTETVCAALLACTNVILNRCAQKAGLEVQSLDLSLKASFDRRGVMLEEEIETPFPEATISITLTANGTNDALAETKANLRRFCPVSKMFVNSGSKVNENWAVTLNGEEI